MGTSVERSSSTDNFATRGEAFGIENKTVNGMDAVSYTHLTLPTKA